MRGLQARKWLSELVCSITPNGVYQGYVGSIFSTDETANSISPIHILYPIIDQAFTKHRTSSDATQFGLVNVY